MSKQCKCCGTREGIKFDFAGQHGDMNVRNGGIRINFRDTSTQSRGIAYAPANYCPMCGRNLRSRS